MQLRLSQATRFARKKSSTAAAAAATLPLALPRKRFEPAAWSPATAGRLNRPAPATCPRPVPDAEPALSIKLWPAFAGTEPWLQIRRCVSHRRGPAPGWTATCPVRRTASCLPGRTGRPVRPACAVRVTAVYLASISPIIGRPAYRCDSATGPL